MSAIRRGRAHDLANAAFRLREGGIGVALAVVIVFFAVRAHNFATAGKWQDIAKDVAVVVV
jgi:hypothetical protein